MDGRLVRTAVFVLVGMAIVVLGLAARKPARIATNDFAFLSTDPRPSITAHNSPAAAANPRKPNELAVADKIDTPTINCTVSLSMNGGENWDARDLVAPDPATHCYWPDPVFDRAGNLFVLYTAMGENFNDSAGVFLQPYAGGMPSGEPTAVTGPNAFHARVAVASERILVTWIQFTSGTPFLAGSGPGSSLVMAVSDDGGHTFGEPAPVSGPDHLLLQPTVVVGHDGEVVVGALDLGADLLDYESRHQGQGGTPYDGTWQVVTYTSADHGATFGPRIVVGDIDPPTRIYPDMSSPAPGFAVDAESGRMYATWDSGVGNERDVYLASSEDAGRSWGNPTRFVRGSSQTLPSVGVAPDGRVDLLFYDRSKDPTDVLTEPVLSSSWDEGRHFTTRSVSSRTFDSRIGFGSSQDMPSLGQQLAVVSQPNRALTFWADTRKGTVEDNNQELALTIVDVTKGRGWNWLLIGVGLVITLIPVLLPRGRSQSSSARPKSR